ncbi:MAG: hypothetical protein LBR08_13105 [Bacteroidales bacterium]|jgi:hypothetical protein|nr:hypothetical protein [Bacteroidales bacterium]
MNTTLQTALKEELERFLSEQYRRFPAHDLLKIDLHCHDCNSSEPDELIGRILNVSETWISSDRVIRELTKNGCDAFTVTNHNNALSCYNLQEKGADILTAAEFSCWTPDFNIGIHVLAYGFTPEQEKNLNRLRRDVYAFQEYTRNNDLPTIWAHPLYHYATKDLPPIAFFDKMLLLFERFEMLNGQRDTWQNLLVKEWIESVTPEKIDRCARQFGIEPDRYCRHPYRKSLSGGSDSHTGIFAGLSGTYLYIPDLQQRLQSASKSQLALEAIKNGDMIPYGSYQNSEKLTISFLDYVCQIALNYKDPGLIRMLLHKGETSDKVISFIVSNAFAELQRHKVTMSFIDLFHNCLLGKKPSFIKKITVPTAYKPVFDEAAKMAKVHRDNQSELPEKYYQSILSISNHMNKLLFSRLTAKIDKLRNEPAETDLEEIINRLELPSFLRVYTESSKRKGKAGFDVNKFLDGLPFPFLASSLILAAHFTSAKVMYNTRPFLKKFSDSLGKFMHPERALG